MKRLFIFCDGTGQDGLIVPSGPTEDSLSPDQAYLHGVTQALAAMAEAPEVDSLEGLGGRFVTNVLRLSRAVKPYSSDDPKIQQIVFYQSGIGSETNFEGGASGPSWINKWLQVLWARNIASKIRDAYGFLAQNYEAGDEVFIFGQIFEPFYQDKIGLLTTENLGVFFNIWKELYDKGQPFIPSDTRLNIAIKCLGVWDTVEAIASEDIDAFGLKDSVLPASVQNALHAVSLQENRQPFSPTLFTLAKDSNQVLKEVWFPGSHSDVGGGYERHELADITLFWMVGEIKALNLFELDYNFIGRSHQQNPDDWGTTQPHNEAAGALWVIAQDRLEGKYITSGQSNHTSWQVAPNPSNPPSHMVTRSRMETQFGTLTYVDRNAYEDDRKTNWKTQLDGTPIVFDDITVLFPTAAITWMSSQSVSSMDGSSQVVQGSLQSGGETLSVGRVSYNDGIHPGKVESDYSAIYIGWGGKEVKLEASDTAFEVLVNEGQRSNVAWYMVEGALSLDNLGGLNPVPAGQESDGTPLYVAKGYLDPGNGSSGVVSGKVKMGNNALVPWGGLEYEVTRYGVLVFKTELYHFHNTAGQYTTGNNWEAIQAGNTNSTLVPLTPKDPTTPRIVVGLNYVDMNMNSDDDWIVNPMAYADSITRTDFCVHLDAGSSSTLYNGGVSWLKLSSGDPDFCCGSVTCSAGVAQSIDFGWRFSSAPTIFAGLSQFNIGDNWRAEIVTSNITETGFSVSVDGWGSTDFNGCEVAWVAVSPGKQGVLCGTFGGTDWTTTGYSGTVNFSPKFSNTPTILTAFSKFDASHFGNMRIKTTVTPSTDKMDWKIQTWYDSAMGPVKVAYLAIDGHF